MGYWRMQGSDSIIFREVPEEEVTGMWGDTPADIIGHAVDEIIEDFQEQFGRVPTKTELKNGLLFTIQVMDELPE